MPEKPEVVTIARILKTRLIGKTIKNVIVLVDKIIEYPSLIEFKQDIKEQKIIDINTVGKWLVFELSDFMLLIHLRMEGKFFFREEMDDLTKHDHVLFKLDNDYLWVYNDTRKFGKMRLMSKDNYLEVPPLSKMGLEEDNPKLTKEYLKNKISKKGIAIKTILLDQTILSGIGNIYADEILFLAKINPLRVPKYLSDNDYDNIIKYFKEVMTKAIQKGGTTINSYAPEEGATGLFQNELLVHTKKTCPVCKTNIVKIKVNGRGTHYCPVCQKN